MLGFARKFVTMHELPLFTLLCSSENCTSPKEHSLNIVEGHRPIGNTTGLGEVVIDHLLSSRPPMHGRSALNVVGRPCMPAKNCFVSSRGKTWHGNAFSSKYLHQHPPYHVHDSKEDGPRPSGHQSRISMRDGPRNQVCHFNVKRHAHQRS